MRIVATSFLSIAILGAAITPGWCPEPADLYVPRSGGSGAAAWQPDRFRRPDQTQWKQGHSNMHLKLDKGPGVYAGGAKDAAKPKRYFIMGYPLSDRPQPSPFRSPSNAAMDRLQ